MPEHENLTAVTAFVSMSASVDGGITAGRYDASLSVHMELEIQVLSVSVHLWSVILPVTCSVLHSLNFPFLLGSS